MAFPLVLNHRTIGTATTVASAVPAVARRNVETRTWKSQSGSTRPTRRSGSTLIRTGQSYSRAAATPGASRWWNGVGGFTRYLPSFPQLDRQSTTFPRVV